MLKKILFTVLVVIALICAITGYLYLKNLKRPKLLATQMMPADCAFVIESENFLDVYKKLNETSLIWDELMQVEQLKNLNSKAALLDSLIRGDEKVNTVFSSTRVYTAAYSSGEKSYDYLFALNLHDLSYSEDVNTYLKSKAAVYEQVDKDASGGKLIKAVLKDPAVTLYVYLNSGFVLISQQMELIRRSLAGQNKISLSTDALFMKLEESSGKNNDFRFFINHRQIDKFTRYLDLKNTCSPLSDAAPHKGWTELDVDLNTNEILLNGFTLADSSVFLSALKHQSPQEIECISALPFSTSAFMFVGMEDRSLFAKDLMSFRKNWPAIEKYSSRLDVDLEHVMNQVAGNELCIFRTSENDTSDVYGLLKINDREEAGKLLSSASDSSVNVGYADSSYHFDDPDFFSALHLGLVRGNFKSCCLSGEYLVFAPGDESLKRYLFSISQNRTLRQNEKFVHFSENNLSREANFYIYTSFAGSGNFLKELVSGELRAAFEKNMGLFTKFNAAAYQLINYKGAILNQAYVLYSPENKQENSSVWETQLDTLADTHPFIVLNHKTGGREVAIQDESQKIYLISNTGKILWKKQLEGKIIGEIHQVDYYKNEKLQMLFNTADKIHLIDRNGNEVPGYPIVLPAPATSALSVFDYEKNKDYRILVPCSNKKVYNYTINTKSTEGFNFPLLRDDIILPVQWLRINQKDYLLAADRSGNIYVTGRRGETRLNMKSQIAKACNAWYIDAGKDLSRTYIHYLDKENKSICRLSLNDIVVKNNFNVERKPGACQFSYINDDGLIDCVLSDETGFDVIDDLGKTLISYSSTENISSGVSMLTVNDQNLFITLEKESGKLIPVNLTGKTESYHFPSGRTLPVMTTFAKGGERCLLTVSGNILYCFKLQ
ncbi:MAG: hypothetical protein ACJ76F_04595 [Bacteroidia bacterium]